MLIELQVRNTGVVGLEKTVNMMTPQSYTVSNGEMVLTLQPAEEGGFVVTSPMDPELITESETLEQAFENARDAAEALSESRRLLVSQLAGVKDEVVEP